MNDVHRPSPAPVPDTITPTDPDTPQSWRRYLRGRWLLVALTLADQTVKDANLAVTLTLNQYRAGIVAYTAVVTAQATALTDSQALLSIRQSRLVASITLIEALGGGWSAGDLSAVHPGLPTPL